VGWDALVSSAGLGFSANIGGIDTKRKTCCQKILVLEFLGQERKLRLVFMGSPRFAVPPLEHLLRNRYQVAAVYTQPDRPAGRGRGLAASPVKQLAQARGLMVVQPASLKGVGVVAQLADFKPDVIVVAAFGQILPKAILELPRLGCINIHPSLLPRYRGASPVASAILAGDDFSGVTIMLMDEGLDTGPLLVRAQVAVSPQDTTGSLTDKLAWLGAGLLGEVLVGWERGELTPRPQDEAGASYSGPIAKEEGEIDWRLPAVAIWRRVRAFDPWPGCYTHWRGKTLKIIEAVPLEGSAAKTGEVAALTAKAGFGVGTGDGVLGVLKVQLEGKRMMPADEFLRGQRGFIGAVLPSD
jgi:methionyl-tRNA formyltransferase